MAVNKVVINDEVQLDLTSDTVTAATLLQGVTAHDATGAPIVGTYVPFVATITVIVDAGAIVTLSYNGVAVQQNTSTGQAYFEVNKSGLYTVTAEKDGQTVSGQINVAEAKRYTIALNFVTISTTLNDNDWATIKMVSDMGEGANYWSVGDCKQVTLNGTVADLTFDSYATYVYILGFDHNKELEGGGIHFQFAKTAAEDGVSIAFAGNDYGKASSGCWMNATNTNVGGWESSAMRTSVCGTSLTDYEGTMIATLPSDLRGVLKTAKKYTNNDEANTTNPATATEDVIFLLSEFELYGSISKANTNEQEKQQQYAYYAAGNARIKYKHHTQDIKAVCWLRSPAVENTRSFVTTNTTGIAYDMSAAYSRGFAPAFCV